ncbi:hypothetical protein TcCL_ESM05109 [Trypanosoma cruzi]|nr:hypothetical protein TcCL_ESM05109 [Trypanosoma cruzi]
MRETLQAPGLPDNTGDWPCATMWQSSTKSQGEAMMAPARKSRPALNGMRRLTPCGYTECTVSSIEVVRRPSLKDASVDDGPLNKIIEGNEHCSNTAMSPATTIPSQGSNSPIMPRMHTQAFTCMKQPLMFFNKNKTAPFPSNFLFCH